MPSLTLEDIPPDRMERLREAAARDRRSLTQQVLVFIEGGLSDRESAEERAERQLAAWRSLAGTVEGLAGSCQSGHGVSMSTMNISLPDTLKAFIEEQVSSRGYASISEYVRELIRRDQHRQALRGLLLEGAASEPGVVADSAYFENLRERVVDTNER